MDEAIEDSYTDRLERENCRLRAEVEALHQLLREVGNSAGFQYMTYEMRDRIDAAIAAQPKE